MNLARGRELGISSRVDEGHDWIHKPSRSFYEGKASVGEATGGSSGDIAVVLGATNGEDEAVSYTHLTLPTIYSV